MWILFCKCNFLFCSFHSFLLFPFSFRQIHSCFMFAHPLSPDNIACCNMHKCPLFCRPFYWRVSQATSRQMDFKGVGLREFSLYTLPNQAVEVRLPSAHEKVVKLLRCPIGIGAELFFWFQKSRTPADVRMRVMTAFKQKLLPIFEVLMTVIGRL